MFKKKKKKFKVGKFNSTDWPPNIVCLKRYSLWVTYGLYTTSETVLLVMNMKKARILLSLFFRSMKVHIFSLCFFSSQVYPAQPRHIAKQQYHCPHHPVRHRGHDAGPPRRQLQCHEVCQRPHSHGGLQRRKCTTKVGWKMSSLLLNGKDYF